MATLIACADGNLTSASTWQTVDATSLLNSSANNTALTTSMVSSSGFTPGAITIDGFTVFLASRAASPSGTMTVDLATGGVSVSGTSVTINVSDLPTCGTTESEGGFIFFKFASPVTLLAATSYVVRASTSVTAQVNLYRDATAGNWSRFLRTTTTAAPVAGDILRICGEFTGAGAITTRTVTMDSTAATDYGPGSAGSAGLTISKGGTLSYGTSAATNYILRLSGLLVVYNGGTLNIGSSGAEIPRTSTAVLEFDCAADNQYYLQIKNGGTFNAHGLSRTAGKDIWYCKLNTDEAVNSTSLGVDTDTGWLDNDVIAIASTSRTYTNSAKGTLNGDAGASTLTVDGFAGTGGGLAFAYTGTSPQQAEIILLTRNVVMRAVTAGFVTYFECRPTAVVSVKWAQFYYMGGTSIHGFNINTTTGSCSFQYCSVHDGDNGGGFLCFGSTWNNVTLQYIGTYAASTVSNLPTVDLRATTGTNYLIDNIIIIRTVFTTYAFTSLDMGGTITNITAAGCSGGGIQISEEGATVGTMGPFTAHSCASTGMQVSGGFSTAQPITIWNGNVIAFATTSLSYTPVILDTLTMFGGATEHIRAYGPLKIRELFSAGTTTFSTTNMVALYEAGSVIVQGGSIGVVSGIFTAHTNLFAPAATLYGTNDSAINNCLIGTGQTDLSAATSLRGGTISFTRYNQVDGSHRIYSRNGSSYANSTVYNTTGPSEELRPAVLTSVEGWYDSTPARIKVDASDTPAVSVFVRKDGAYAGDQPKLMILANGAVGVDEDTLLDTMAGGSGSFEELTATLPAALSDGVYEVVVRVTGTTGSVFVDDWSSTP